MNLFHQKPNLASGLPRRKQRLQEAAFDFTVFPLKVSEKLRENLRLDDQIKEIVVRKSQTAEASLGLQKQKDYWPLTVDTVVALDQEVLGKPTHAKAMASGFGRAFCEEMCGPS